MTIRWFLSRTVRQLTEMCRQMQRVLNEQRDLLSPEAVAAVHTSRAEALAAIHKGAKEKELHEQMKQLEETARKWFQPYANAGIRENVKEFLVAIVVILSFTTFFLQLTKIPTGSMQPTLYGITQQNLKNNPDFKMPGFAQRMYLYWFYGISYKHLVAPEDGKITMVYPPQTVFPFVKRQVIEFNRKKLSIWFPPEDGVEQFGELGYDQTYKKGEDILKLRVVAGDHLLVDRMTYNFRHPKRGEIIVFKTKGIVGIPHQDQLYIKRLVGMPNEEIRIGDDQHLIIDGKRLDSSTRHFEMVYAMDGTPKDFPYVGHVNGKTGFQKYGRLNLAPVFPDANSTFKISPHHYMAMGDNTLNSADSRTWGELPQENIIGRCWFVYWPFNDRFGWGYR
jgi:signal peptidase I